jgi:hypothetical protein
MTKYDYISRSITTHGRMRRLPHQGADHGTVDHGFPSDGVFLLHERVLPSRWLIPLQRSSSSLSSLWMASWCEWLSPPSNGGAQAFRVQDPSGARKTGPNRPPEWAGPAGLGPPRPSSVAPFAPVGPYAFMYFASSTCMILTMLSSRPRWRFSAHEVRSFMLQSPRVFHVALRSLPPLEVISSSS